MLWDLVGALWIVMVAAVFLGVGFGLPEASVAVLEKVYALVLIVGLVKLALRATTPQVSAKGAKGRD